jgi:hypothetical protein
VYSAEDDDPALDKMRARQADEYTIEVLHGGGVDGKKWIDEKPDRILSGQTRAKSVQIIHDFYDAGVREVRVYPLKRGGVEQADDLIVVTNEDKTPEAAASRAKAWALMESLAKQLDRVKPRDRGMKYWPIQMLTDAEISKLAPQSFDQDRKAPDDGKDDDDGDE